MTHRLPGTAPLDSFRAKGGRYLSVLLDGPATSEAEMAIAHYLADGTRMPTEDFRIGIARDPEGSVAHLIRDDIILTLYADSSVVMRRRDGHTDILFPLGVQLDKWILASAVVAAFAPIRAKAGYTPLPVSQVAQTSVCDLRAMLFSQECDSIVEEIFSDARRLFEAREPLGILQAVPSDDPRLGFFPPLRGLPRAEREDMVTLDNLHAAMQVELQLLYEEVPFLRNEEIELLVRGSLPDRDGSLRPPMAHLLMNEYPMDWEAACLVQPALNAYCASTELVPDRSVICEYKHGRVGRGALSPAGALPAIEPTNIMVIRPREDLTAHERIELTALRNQIRARHSAAILDCADALDEPWDSQMNQHAHRYTAPSPA